MKKNEPRFKKIFNTLKQVDLTDLFILCGLAMAGVGIWQIYPPAALIIIGTVLFLLGLLGSMRGSGKSGK